EIGPDIAIIGKIYPVTLRRNGGRRRGERLLVGIGSIHRIVVRSDSLGDAHIQQVLLVHAIRQTYSRTVEGGRQTRILVDDRTVPVEGRGIEAAQEILP